jgi:hypothetical protein
MPAFLPALHKLQSSHRLRHIRRLGRLVRILIRIVGL